MALVGILYHTGTHHVAFLCFSKDKSPEFQCHLEQDESSSDLLISYPLIIQTQIKHMLPTSFKFRVNPYIKIVLSKTQENSHMFGEYDGGPRSYFLDKSSCIHVFTKAHGIHQFKPLFLCLVSHIYLDLVQAYATHKYIYRIC